jgi:hypothetical protein
VCFICDKQLGNQHGDVNDYDDDEDDEDENEDTNGFPVGTIA